MSIAKLFAGLLAALLLLFSQLFPQLGEFLGQGPVAEGRAETAGHLSGEVLRMADGDSFRLRTTDGQEVEIRMHGIDAPERAQPYGRSAAAALERYVRGKRLDVEIIEEDDYGRQVGVVYVDGDNINLAMVREGHAWWYEYYASGDRDLAEAQQRAVSRRLGLWAAQDAPVAPWDWRRRQR